MNQPEELRACDFSALDVCPTECVMMKDYLLQPLSESSLAYWNVYCEYRFHYLRPLCP